MILASPRDVSELMGRVDGVLLSTVHKKLVTPTTLQGWHVLLATVLGWEGARTDQISVLVEGLAQSVGVVSARDLYTLLGNFSEQGLLFHTREHRNEADGWSVRATFAEDLYLLALQAYGPEAVLRAMRTHAQTRDTYGTYYTDYAAVAYLRAICLCAEPSQLDGHLSRLPAAYKSLSGEVLERAVFAQCSKATVQAMGATAADRVVTNLLSAANEFSATPSVRGVDLLEYANLHVQAHPTQRTFRVQLAIQQVLKGNPFAAREALGTPHNVESEQLQYAGFDEMLQGACFVLEAQWDQACGSFTQGWVKSGRAATTPAGAEGDLHPSLFLVPYYLLALLALGGEDNIHKAREIASDVCSNTRQPLRMGFRMWVHAINGKSSGPFNPDELKLLTHYSHADWHDPWRMLLRAWVGAKKVPAPLVPNIEEGLAYTNIDNFLAESAYPWLQAQLHSGYQVWRGAPAPPSFFIAPPTESWEDALAVLESIVPLAQEEERVIWVLDVSRDGALKGVAAQLQKRGSKGSWLKPKDVAISKLLGMEVSAHDRTVLDSATSRSFIRPSDITLNWAKAIRVLVGHPYVTLTSNMDVFVHLKESAPELTQDADPLDATQLVVSIFPPLRNGLIQYPGDQDAPALSLLTLIGTAQGEVTLYSFSEGQYKVWQQFSRPRTFPLQALSKLNTIFDSLGSQFVLQSDQARADEELSPKSKLRVELSNQGIGEGGYLIVRLAAAPLGEKGPRFVPGEGRIRVVNRSVSPTQGTRRDLDVETHGAEQVLASCEILRNLPTAAPFEWQVQDLESCIGVLAQFQGLLTQEIITALDWPRGRPIKASKAKSAQLQVRVSSGTNWFAVNGELKVSEDLVVSLKDLFATSRVGSYLQMADGQYLQLSDDLKAKLHALESIAEVDKGGAKVPALAAQWLAELLEGVQTEFDAGAIARIDALKTARENSWDVPVTLTAELRPYQIESFNWMMALQSCGFGAVLADDRGIGKTIQALAIALARQPLDSGPLLVVATVTGCDNWKKQATKFAPGLSVRMYGDHPSVGKNNRAKVIAEATSADLVVVTYGTFLADQILFLSRKWSMAILDEAQNIKNPTAKRAAALFEIEAGFRLALSGTPVENRLMDLWSLFRFANPGLLGSMKRFRERFITPIEKWKEMGEDGLANRLESQSVLRKLIGPFIMRRKKRDVLLDLPPSTEKVIEVAPSEEEAAFYEALRRKFLEEAEKLREEKGERGANVEVLKMISRLRLAACDPRLIAPGLSEGAKMQAFIETSDDLVANGHKTLVFSQSIPFLAMMQNSLKQRGYKFLYFDGQTARKERDRMVDEFQAEGAPYDFFLISTGAGNSSIELTAADYVIITDPWFNPAREDQATDRAIRDGQKKSVTVYRFVTKGTVEERILEMHTTKRELAESIYGEGDAQGFVANTAELIALMQA